MNKAKLQILVQDLRKCFIKKRIKIEKIQKSRLKTYNKLFLVSLKSHNLKIVEIISSLKSIAHKSMANYQSNSQSSQ